MQVRKLAVAWRMSKHHRRKRTAGSRSDLGNLVFESVGKVDLRAHLGAVDRTADRLVVHLDVAGNAQAALALSLRRFVLHKGCTFPFAFVNWTRPTVHSSDIQPRQIRIAVDAFIDRHGEDSLASTLVRQSAELAVAAIFTIAIGKFAT